MPIAATIITVGPDTGAGSTSRRIASAAIPPVTTSSRMALNSADRIEERRSP